MKYPKKQDMLDAAKKLNAFLAEWGVVSPNLSYATAIGTALGKISISPHFEPKSRPWIACNFEDLDLAKARFCSTPLTESTSRLNRFSGKWNFHDTMNPGELVDIFIGNIVSIGKPVAQA